MLDAIRTFLARRVVGEAAPGQAPAPLLDGLQVAAAALLLELAHADGHFSDAERTHIEEALGRHFALDEDTTRELLALAEAERRESIDHFQFTRHIARHYDTAQKLRLAELMWRVILADGAIAEHETWLVRKLANMLELSPGYLSEARRLATGDAGPA
ncbi:MAG TPA: TerB family tellurite resistance protein [Gemmatimonadales bacterium]|nr:TerB family tellurite resistance protein [Gemmatimonadales bacterium]